MGGLMQDKVVLVTGAGRGIGRGIARRLAAEGARVVVNDRGSAADGEGTDAGPAQAVVDEIRADGGAAVASTHSVDVWDEAHAMVALALDTWGRIDGLVNNAGILRDTIFHKMSEADFDAVVGVHLKGSFNVARAAAPHFRKQESGAMLHMTSNSALVGNYGQANYAAAKLGIVGLSKSIALDMHRFKVRSNCISPTAWSRLTGSIPETADGAAARLQKIKAMEPELVAPLAVSLLADPASGISGQIFAVRRNEIFLVSQTRPIRSVHRADGWTPQTVVDHAFPALAPSFYPLARSADVFSWDPI